MHKMTANVVGMKKFEGYVGEGQDRQKYKGLTLFVLMPMQEVDTKTGEQEIGRKGALCVEHKSDDFRIWDELAKQHFPVSCELEFETFATGQGRTKDVLISVKPRGAVNLAKAS